MSKMKGINQPFGLRAFGIASLTAVALTIFAFTYVLDPKTRLLGIVSTLIIALASVFAIKKTFFDKK